MTRCCIDRTAPMAIPLIIDALLMGICYIIAKFILKSNIPPIQSAFTPNDTCKLVVPWRVDEIRLECVVFVSMCFFFSIFTKKITASHPIQSKCNCNRKEKTTTHIQESYRSMKVARFMAENRRTWFDERLGYVRTCVAFTERQWAQQVGVNSVQHSFNHLMECVKTREKAYCRSAWARNDPIYKRIACKATVKCFKNFRIAQLW